MEPLTAKVEKSFSARVLRQPGHSTLVLEPETMVSN